MKNTGREIPKAGGNGEVRDCISDDVLCHVGASDFQGDFLVS